MESTREELLREDNREEQRRCWRGEVVAGGHLRCDEVE